MKSRTPLSFARFWAIVIKEFVQMRRDRLTFGMIIGIPVVQLMLFGYAINGDPKHLPTAVVLADTSQYGRSLLSALTNSDYFNIVSELHSEAEAEAALA
ncbi:MAG TPA: ABC transporter permease, partial [Dongiaceae bacterium]|nr:ABC transporter permease [Dongiaceae bacterium]